MIILGGNDLLRGVDPQQTRENWANPEPSAGAKYQDFIMRHAGSGNLDLPIDNNLI